MICLLERNFLLRQKSSKISQCNQSLPDFRLAARGKKTDWLEPPHATGFVICSRDYNRDGGLEEHMRHVGVAKPSALINITASDRNHHD